MSAGIETLKRRVNALAPQPAAGKDVPEMYISPESTEKIRAVLAQEQGPPPADWDGNLSGLYISNDKMRQIGDILAAQKQKERGFFPGR